ncbi:MAG: hypothetical protein LBF19_07670 [Prevotellaceae bacterium]|jgi:uncharacterized protein (TIGR02145 family)|nr:hypothetical protein [Prevotellaceae bacterium]
MRKIFLLSMLSLASMSVWGQAQVVQVEQLSATYGANPTVTFRVYWTTPPDGVRHLDSVWLFVDYLLIENNAPVGDWTPATITGVVSVSDGTPSYPVALPYRGFYLQGNPAGAFSSTIAVALDGLANAKFNWCAYATDYPPNATEAAGHYELHGSPPFLINGVTAESSKTYTGGCITVLTDATGCPGIPPAQPVITAFEATPDTICAGDTITLMAATNIVGAASYSFNGGAWTTDNAATFTPSATTNYTLYIRNIAGCTATAAPALGVVHPRPEPSFVNPPDTACAGSSVTLTATGGSSYCFTQECINCIRNPYESGNDEEGAAHCYILPTQCSYTPDSTYTLVMPESGSVTVWVRVINDNGCTDSISTTIKVRAMPPAPVLAASATYCASSAAIPFTGVAGYSYQLQDNMLQGVGASTFGAGLLTLPFAASGTYTVVVTDDATGCTAVSNAQEATVEAAPNIILSSAVTTTSQTVAKGTAITPVQYTTTNATGATLTGQPSGVSGSWTSNVYTISGTPTVTGTFNYTVTTTNSNGCPNATATGTITVNLAVIGCIPASLNLGTVGFSSTTTYSRNGLIISSPVTATYCNNRCGSFDGDSGNDFKADCAWIVSAGTAGFLGRLFSWCMVMQYADQLCPSPWRVPTKEDHCRLVNGDPGICTTLSESFNGKYGYFYTGYASSSGCYSYMKGYYWSSTENNDSSAYCLYFDFASGRTIPQTTRSKAYGHGLRCVRDLE